MKLIKYSVKLMRRRKQPKSRDREIERERIEILAHFYLYRKLTQLNIEKGNSRLYTVT